MRTFLTITFAALFLSFNSYAKTTFSKQSDTLKKGKNYNLFSKSDNIDRIDFDKSKKSKENIVYIRFGFPKPMPTSNNVNANLLQSNRKYTEDGSLPVFDKIDIIKGKYADIKLARETAFRNLFTLTGVEFPLQLKLYSGKESIDLELNEAGEWNIGIELKNN